MKNRRMALVLAMWSAATVGQAQTADPQQTIDRRMNVMVVRGGDQGAAPLPVGSPAEFDFLTTTTAIGGEPVTGAPYAAEAVTEVVQTLADGNRIVRQSTSAVYRDGAGRTRREQGLAVIGGMVGGGGDRTQVLIHDPEAGALYVLDTERRTVHRLPAPKVVLSGDGTAASEATFNLPVPPPAGGEQTTVFMRRTVTPGPNAGPGNATVEQLGRKVVEGVEAEGAKSTLTIPAGQIGNEQPITIVSERWFSPELKLLVMSRQSDPRFGETTYRLTNIVRSEPSPELFQVPSDFTTIDPPAGNRMLRIEKK